MAIRVHSLTWIGAKTTDRSQSFISSLLTLITSDASPGQLGKRELLNLQALQALVDLNSAGMAKYLVPLNPCYNIV
jgi:hypothetical protein